MELLLCRHGESINNTLPPERHIPDPELTSAGRRQAAALAGAVVAEAPDVIISSPLLRAMDTAAPLARALRVPWLVWALAAEAHRAHPSDGQPVAALRARFPEARLTADLPWPGYPGPETPGQAAERAADLLRRLRDDFGGGKRVALVAHGTLNGYLLRACLGVSPSAAVEITQDNACVSRLSFDADGRCRLLNCNDTRHLRGLAAGL